MCHVLRDTGRAHDVIIPNLVTPYFGYVYASVDETYVFCSISRTKFVRFTNTTAQKYDSAAYAYALYNICIIKYTLYTYNIIHVHINDNLYGYTHIYTHTHTSIYII